MRKHAAFTALFLAFLAFFVWNSSWHASSRLVIRGHVESPDEVRVSWDSGSGFNDMESADVVFGNPVNENVKKSGTIRIRKVGLRHPAAKADEVRIKALQRSQDEKPMDLKTLAGQKGVGVTDEGHLRLQSAGSDARCARGQEVHGSLLRSR